VQDVVAGLQRKANLDDKTIDRVRLWEVHNNKIHKLVKPDASVVNLSDYCSLFAEAIPEEEDEFKDADEDTVAQIAAFHFDRETSKTHFVPFVFYIKSGELFKDTKERLSKRIGIKGKAFEKIKFAIVQRHLYQKPIYLSDGKASLHTAFLLTQSNTLS
jgi:ubiquitin carboxyl-terminal hydrolase 7